MRPRHIASITLILGLTATAFIVARALTARDVRRDTERRAEVAVAQIHDRIEQGVSLTSSLSRFMYDAAGVGVTTAQFAKNALRWLNPAEFPAAAWAEEVPAGGRATYERRIGRPIVARDARHTSVPPAPAYLPATLVSGFPPLDLRGVDLRREPGMAVALRDAFAPGGVAATPVAGAKGSTAGLFLVAPAPNRVGGRFRPGAVAVFVPEGTLRAATGNAWGLRLVTGPQAARDPADAHTVRKDFFAAGRRFAVVMPTQPVSGPAAAVPWIILAAGVVLSLLAAGLGVNAARRSKAQAEVDRIFTLSSDLIAVADFEGHFTRVNPAVEQILGYTQGEFLAKPYLELVHPDDRHKTAAQAAAIAQGQRTLSFENRYIHKDGSPRVLDWTASPVVEEGLMYGVARDVTERRQAEAELERLAGEQAALRRVATLVAEGAAPTIVFDAVTSEMSSVFGSDGVLLTRYEGTDEITYVAHRGPDAPLVPVGTRLRHEPESISGKVLQTRAPARMENYSQSHGAMGDVARTLGIRGSVGAPILVEGRIWGVAIAYWRGDRSPPSDTEERLANFTELLEVAIANADSHDQLTASRVRLLTEADDARRRVVRDLHDGAQQRLVHSIITLGLAKQAFETGEDRAAVLVEEALAEVKQGNEELRELAHGILPSVLNRGGLRAGIDSVVSRLKLPVAVHVPEMRWPREIEASAYFILSEALTNVVKHAQATRAEVTVSMDDGVLRLQVRDDGIGGADSSGHGLVGLADRASALGGSLAVSSAEGGGTVVTATLAGRRSDGAD